jgi:hypothetical protein
MKTGEGVRAMSRRAKPQKRKAKAAPPWSERMAAAQLNRWAEVLLAVPLAAGIKPTDDPLLNPRRDAPLRPLALSDADRWALATYLRSLADPRTVKAIARSRGAKPRGRRADPARSWKAALEFHLRRGSMKKDLLAAEVGRVWKIQRSRLWEIYAARRDDPRWREWARYELARLRATSRGTAPAALRAAVIKQLHAPGNQRK